jgi:tetratricopeptide (TPR) repeat protein
MRGSKQGFVFILTLFCSILGAHAQATPAAVVLQTADTLLEEAEMIDGRNLRKAVTGQAAALYVNYANAAGGTKGAEALLKAAQLYIEMGDVDAMANALACTTAVVVRPDAISLAPDALLLQAQIFREQREWGRAVRAAMNCAERFPRSEQAPTALFTAAEIMEKNIRNTREADTLYARIVESYSGSTITDQALFARASLRSGEGQHEAAIADYLAVTKSYPESALADQAMHDAIMVYDRKLKDFVKAYELAVLFRETFPDSSFLRRVSKVESKNLRYVKDAGL